MPHDTGRTHSRIPAEHRSDSQARSEEAQDLHERQLVPPHVVVCNRPPPCPFIFIAVFPAVFLDVHPQGFQLVMHGDHVGLSHVRRHGFSIFGSSGRISNAGSGASNLRRSTCGIGHASAATRLTRVTD